MKKLFTILSTIALVVACGSKKNSGVAKSENTKSFTSTNKLEKSDLARSEDKQSSKPVNKLEKNRNLKSAIFITDGNTVNDKSFNETQWKGVAKYTSYSSENYIVPKVSNPAQRMALYKDAHKKAQVLVLGGFQHNDSLKKYYSEIPKGKGVIFIDGVVEAPNINSIIFKMQEAAFYAGYLAAKYLSEKKDTYDTEASKGLKVGTYGGMNFPTVTAFMAGFQQGVEFWNANVSEGEHKIEFVKLGSTADSYFSGNFKQGTGKALSEKLINAGADIILPVAGPQTLDTLEVIKNKKSSALVIGVDTDQHLMYEEHQDKFFTSVLKHMDVAAYDSLRHILDDSKNEIYGLGKTTLGTMSNYLIGLATDGGNHLTSGDYDDAKSDDKVKAAAEKATDKFKA